VTGGTGPNDFAAFSIVEQHFSETAVPEPSTMLLLGSGLIGLVRFRKKFRE